MSTLTVAGGMDMTKLWSEDADYFESVVDEESMRRRLLGDEIRAVVTGEEAQKDESTAALDEAVAGRGSEGPILIW